MTGAVSGTVKLMHGRSIRVLRKGAPDNDYYQMGQKLHHGMDVV